MPTNTSDTYPRVRPCAQARADWDFDTEGTHKVVPADAIVIERNELLPVRRGTIDEAICDGFGYSDPDAAHRAAVALLSAEAALREHPPVDEREVEALTRLIAKADKGSTPAWDMAHTILATGRVHVDTEDGA